MSRQAARYQIFYTDGTDEIVARRPVHNMRAERVYASDAGANEVMLATFWACATGGTGSRQDFEEWAETVEEWDPISRDPEAGDAAPLDLAPDGSPKLEQ
jgi:hypothetical protein